MLLAFGINRDGQCGLKEESSGAPTSPTRDKGCSPPVSSPVLREPEPPSVLFPRPVRCNFVIKTVSAGSRHTLALSAEGVVFSWGWGAQGQLGLGHNHSVICPTRIDELVDPVVSISAGGIHSGCINSIGFCYMWGSSEYGQLGLGADISYINKPRYITDKDTTTPMIFSKVSCGGMHTAAIDASQELWCWGRADSGQTGTGKWVFSYFPGVVYPKKVADISGVLDVCCGGFHTVVLKNDGCVLAMGKEDFGVLGTGIGKSGKMKQGTETLTEITELLGQRVVGISCGGWHSYFWTDEGKLYSCGKGEYGRLGSGSEQNVPVPAQVVFDEEDVRVVSASCGGSHSIILSSKGGVYVVGRSDDGRLGLGNISQSKITKPRLLHWEPDGKLMNHVLQVIAGGAHTMILTEEGDGQAA